MRLGVFLGGTGENRISNINAARRLLASPVGDWVSDISAARRLLRVIGSRISVRLGVSCSSLDLGYQCGSASAVRDPISDYNAARRFLWVSRREPDLGLQCGSASLGRRLSLDSNAARRRLGVVCRWI